MRVSQRKPYLAQRDICAGSFCLRNEKRRIATTLFSCPKCEHWSIIQLSIVFSLSADNRYANDCTAADKQQYNPKSKLICIASL